MSERWFRVPDVGSGTATDPHRPKYRGEVDAAAGHQIGTSPVWVVLFRASTATLDSIASNSDATQLTAQKALDLLNGSSVAGLQGSGRPWTESELAEHFAV